MFGKPEVFERSASGAVVSFRNGGEGIRYASWMSGNCHGLEVTQISQDESRQLARKISARFVATIRNAPSVCRTKHKSFDNASFTHGSWLRT